MLPVTGELPAAVTGRVWAASAGALHVREYRLGPGYTLTFHAHCEAGLVVPLAGRFELEAGGIRYDLEPGRALVLPADLPHRESVGVTGARCLLIESAGQEKSGRTERTGESDPRVRVVRGKAIDQLRMAIAPIECPAADDLEKLVAPTEIPVIDMLSSEPAVPRLPEWLRRALRAARSDPNVKVAQLARAVGVRPETLCRGFVSVLGMTPSACLMSNRLEEAARLLVASERTISSIASALGFADQSHLTNAFRARFGIPPGRMRRLAATTTDGPVRFLQDSDPPGREL